MSNVGKRRFWLIFFAMDFLLFATVFSLFLYTQQRSQSNSEEESIAFFYTGQLLGELEPCGCSSVKRGGMLQRSGWLRKLQQEMTQLVAVDGGFASPKEERQAEIKFATHHQMLRALGYQGQFLFSQEKIPTEVARDSLFFVAAGRPEIGWYRLLPLKVGGATWSVLLMAVEKEMPGKEQVAAVIAQHKPDLVFAMTQGLEQAQATMFPEGTHQTMIFAVDAPEPFNPRTLRANTLLLSAGNRGRYAGLLVFHFVKGVFTQWNHRTVALEKGLPHDKRVSELLEKYKKQLKDEQLLQRQLKRISPIGFVGSETCAIKGCHPYEYGQWQAQEHARAFDTLVNERQDYDPECVGCHVVGYDFEEGFRTPEETSYLLHVGCEACHGPGAAHATSAKEAYGRVKGDKKMCLTCHEKDRSPQFDYDTFLERIKHWQEKNE
jgi:hypothetical protein